MVILGAFLALKVPGGHEVDFSQSKRYLFHNENICLHILTKFQKIEWTDPKLLSNKPRVRGPPLCVSVSGVGKKN